VAIRSRRRQSLQTSDAQVEFDPARCNRANESGVAAKSAPEQISSIQSWRTEAMSIPLPIIPLPQLVEQHEGGFVINAYTRIEAPSVLGNSARRLVSMLGQASGFDVKLAFNSSDQSPGENYIQLVVGNPDATLGPEGYELEATPEFVKISAPEPAGIFYGVQTLRQLLPLPANGARASNGKPCLIPAVKIRDWPRFKWRGLHLDVGRHMFPVSFIKKWLDLMAVHKLNRFHWHLTEDQGWRLEIKAYPRLTRVGSWRAETPILDDIYRGDGRSYGGYYTQEEVREVVAYASERFITVLPEIEMPGHALAALASYPELGCTGNGYAVGTRWGIEEDVFCAGNEESYRFVENVLAEVMDLFPSEYIHVGGDECPKVRWVACPKCQGLIEREGLADEDELQSYFVRRVEAFLSENGRKLVGWDEILEGGLAPHATVMSWRGTAGGFQAAEAGHDVVMSPTSHCYLDYYQSRHQENEPPAIGGFISLEKIYAFDPADGIPQDKAHHVLGGQANLWSEYINTNEQAEYMAYPRATALAEVVWSKPEDRVFAAFRSRLQHHLVRLERMGVNYRRLDEGG
jgi:hexosaminidase